MKKLFILPIVFTASAFLAACMGLPFNSQSSGSPTLAVTPVSATQAPGTDPANGEQIYFRGIDKNGNHVSYTGGPNFGGMMMGNYLTCASCHGPDAHGGKHIMAMEVMDAPAIYYSALTSMMVQESGGTQQPGGYSLQDFQQAVVNGKHPDGDTLDTDMPRWQMSDQDLADLFAFLKTIQK